jgi:4-diphosphocytidyl-2-C-methyl-D-erythritol kinase
MILNGLAYGKINLYLDVLDKRSDGYHNIKSVMQSVSLCDEISLEIFDASEKNEIEIISSVETLKCDKTNLIYKAWEHFISATNIEKKRCAFTLKKQIPMSAGMAGGSTDAACALRLLNEAFDFPLSLEELLKLSSKIGADVSFCLIGGTCICEGIGEKITPINNLSDIYLVCAIDSSSVSTPVAFKMLDEKYGENCTDSSNINKMITAINDKSIDLVCSSLYNKFENVIMSTNESIQKIKAILLENGACGSLMSGSGPSVFGIFSDKNSQQNAYFALKSCGINAFLCKTI